MATTLTQEELDQLCTCEFPDECDGEGTADCTGCNGGQNEGKCLCPAAEAQDADCCTTDCEGCDECGEDGGDIEIDEYEDFEEDE